MGHISETPTKQWEMNDFQDAGLGNLEVSNFII